MGNGHKWLDMKNMVRIEICDMKGGDITKTMTRFQV